MTERKYNRVAVLMGGWNAEREVSLSTGNACATALEGEGYDVVRIDVGRDIATRLETDRPDACFNALHGKWGEDGCIQGILEVMGIPYSHSGVLASSVALHKEHAKTVLAAAGVPVAESRVLTREEASKGHPMDVPYVLKPPCEGSSVGIVIVKDGSNFDPATLANEGEPDDELMAERYIAGRELTCGILDGKPTGVTEILPLGGLAFYDYEAKYAKGGSRHILPAEISPNLYEYIQKLTLAAHEVLGCRGVSRTDFRFDPGAGDGGELICLETNTQPGMTPTSLVPELAEYAGWSFGELVRWIVEDAGCNR
ncbi:MAG: D-alanine--D-alanine ligase [Hyphomicrobiaceae bacterium]